MHSQPGDLRGLLVAAVILGVAVVGLLLFLLFGRGGTESTTPEVATTQGLVRLTPSDETVQPVKVSQSGGQSNDAVIEVQPWQAPTYTESGAINEVVVEGEPSFSVDDLSHLDLGPYTSTPSPSTYVPPTPVVYEPTPVVVPEIPQDEPAPVIKYDRLGSRTFKSCGEVAVPTGFGLLFFETTLPDNEAVICMGEAVGGSCRSARFDVTSAGEDAGRVFVTKRPDGECGVGIALDTNLLSLCSIKDMMNASTGESRSESYWLSQFDADPGQTFTDLYINNQTAINDPEMVDSFNCKVYESSNLY